MEDQDAVTAGDADRTDDSSDHHDQQLVILDKAFHIADEACILICSIAVKLIRIGLLAHRCAEPEDRDECDRENHCSDKIAVSVGNRFACFIDSIAETQDQGHSDHRKDDTDNGSAGAAGRRQELADA